MDESQVLALSAVGAATLRRYGAIDYGQKWHLRPALWRKRLSSQGDTSHHQQRTAQAPSPSRRGSDGGLVVLGKSAGGRGLRLHVPLFPSRRREARPCVGRPGKRPSTGNPDPIRRVPAIPQPCPLGGQPYPFGWPTVPL